MKHIELSRGLFAIVDDADFEYINQWKWFAKSNGKFKNGFYAARSVHFKNEQGKNSGRTVFMHRVILGIDGVSHKIHEADHVNHNGLDNRKCNLRLADRSKNCSNKRKKENTVTAFKGVSVQKNGRFNAHIKHKQKNISIGSFDTPVQAAMAYDLKAKELFGEFANTNMK